MNTNELLEGVWHSQISSPHKVYHLSHRVRKLIICGSEQVRHKAVQAQEPRTGAFICIFTLKSPLEEIKIE